MAGNKEREKEVNEKLVLENEHLLPRVRGSEKELMMAVEEEEEEGHKLRQEQEREQRMVVEEEKTQRNKNKKMKMNRQKVKQRLLVGGGVENQMDVD